MDERSTDELLKQLFKRNAAYVNDAAVQEQVRRGLPCRRRRGRANWTARAAAIALASIVLMGAAAYGALELVDHLRRDPLLVLTDPTLAPDGTVTSGMGAMETSASAMSELTDLQPVAGTAVLEEVKSEGTVAPVEDLVFVERITGRVQVFTLDMSEPTVSGTLQLTSDLSVRADGSKDVQGSWVLINDRGTWQCSLWTGYLSASGTEEFGLGRATGTGAYEGLTLSLQWHSEVGSQDSLAFTGWVEPTD